MLSMDLSLAAVLKDTWIILESMVSRNSAQENIITLATVDPENQPQACSVVLRGIDTTHGLLEFYTDADSLKCKSISHNPNAQILIWKPELSVQLRLYTEIRLTQGQMSKNRWKRVPVISQTSYGKDPSTGTSIKMPHAYKTLSSEEKFVVANCWIRGIDFLSLKEKHWRAQFNLDGEWVGQWIVP